MLGSHRARCTNICFAKCVMRLTVPGAGRNSREFLDRGALAAAQGIFELGGGD